MSIPLKRLLLLILILLCTVYSEDIKDIVIEDHIRTIENYGIFLRVRDKLLIRNTSDNLFRGCWTTINHPEYIRYYDELGTIHQKSKHDNINLFAFRYPLKKDERVSFTIERLSWNTDLFELPWPEAKRLNYTERVWTIPKPTLVLSSLFK
ncbi:hypothetical protein NEOKW01_0582 [Nematocida sp. AWRm80]|nr:hypothetical protein NEOKW01_0582 [Nematocida sp. AWRm80]